MKQKTKMKQFNNYVKRLYDGLFVKLKEIHYISYLILEIKKKKQKSSKLSTIQLFTLLL